MKNYLETKLECIRLVLAATVLFSGSPVFAGKDRILQPEDLEYNGDTENMESIVHVWKIK